MIAKRLGIAVASALMAVAVAGCGTSPPGGGVTNGPEPASAPETSAVRTDIPPPDIPDKDLEPSKAQSSSPTPDQPSGEVKPSNKNP